MSQTTKTEQISPIYESIKSFVSKITWKNSLFVTIPLGIYLLRWSIAKLFLEVVVELKRSQLIHMHQNQIKEIIITSNEAVNLENLQELRTTGTANLRMSEFKIQNCKTLDYTYKKQTNGSLGTMHLSQVQSQRGKSVSDQRQTLWNKFIEVKQKETQLQLLLIKGPQDLLKMFVLKFYGLKQHQAHKLGQFSPNKLHILRLDEHMGTYEHLLIQIQLQL